MITDRDIEILRMLDETGGLDAPSLQLMFSLSEDMVYRRLRQLRQHGMVEAAQPFYRQPALFLPTLRGLRELLNRDDIVPPSISMTSYNHQLQLGRVLAQLSAHGVAWEASRVTRRNQVEARADGDREGERRYGIKLSWLTRSHLPDALIWTSQAAIDAGRPTALEVELTQKTKARLDDIVLGYDMHPDFAGVVYACGSRPALHAVTRAFDRAKLTGTRPGLINITTVDQFGPHFPRLNAESTDAEREAHVTKRDWLSEYLEPGPTNELERFFVEGPREPAVAGDGMSLLD
jgi:hypothetical protein